MVAKASTKSGEFFCFHCGKKVAKADTECKSCGSEFDKITEAFRCPRCSNLLPIGAAACPACGLGFKVRTISSASKLSEDDKFLMKLIDWGKQGEAPPPKSQVTRSVKTPPPPPPTVMRKVTPSESPKPALAPKLVISAPKPAPETKGVIREAPKVSVNAPVIEPPKEIQVEPAAMPKPIVQETEEPVEVPTEEELTQEEEEAPEVLPTPAPAPAIVEQVKPTATVAQPPSEEKGLSNLALKRLLEEREREVSTIKEREEELARKEEHLNRKIRAYAVKKKELDTLTQQLDERQKRIEAPPQSADEEDEEDFPKELVVDDKNQWIKEQTRIKSGLIEIRNQMSPKKEVTFAQPQVSSDIAEKIEILEEKLDEVTKERDELTKSLQGKSESMADVVTLLKVLDQLLGRLPPETIDEFSKSKDFKLYERVLDDLNI